jgi:putative CocE/NonD family hydrolase
MERWYLGPQSSLTRTAPADSESDGYEVDFQTSTGTQNRWYTQMGGGDVVYPDRVEADRRLLTYTSAPLERDLEVTGNAIMTLRLTTSAADAAFFVYLEDVAPDGRVTYVTEGQLRGIHRLVTAPPYRVLYPYHSFRERDAAPMTPGALSEIRFGLLPTSVLFQRGHRIRLALAGADKDTFARVPADGAVTWWVSRTASAPSYVELPVVPRPNGKQ